MLLRAVRVVVAGALFSAVAVSACGNTSDSNPSATGGSGGVGQGGASGHGGTSGASARGGSSGAPATQSQACGTNTCNGVTLAFPGQPVLAIPGCCSDADTNTCGLDSTFLNMFGPGFMTACQPLAQPGAVDTSCPDRNAAIPNMPGVNITFPGCCRAGGTCGYQLDNIAGFAAFHLGLGCVDSTTFLDGGTPMSCGDTGGAGAGQGGGAGEGSAASSGAGAAGESTAGGASGT
jgi:hypothetical protein